MHLVDQAVGLGLLRGHEIIALAVRGDLPRRSLPVFSARMSVQPLLDGRQTLSGLDLPYPCTWPWVPPEGWWIMISALGSAIRLPLVPAREQERAHGRRHADADGGDIALDVLHGVVDGHAGGDAAAGAVDIELNVLIRVLGFQIQQLGNHQRLAGGVCSSSSDRNTMRSFSRREKMSYDCARRGWSAQQHRELNSW